MIKAACSLLLVSNIKKPFHLWKDGVVVRTRTNDHYYLCMYHCIFLFGAVESIAHLLDNSTYNSNNIIVTQEALHNNSTCYMVRFVNTKLHLSIYPENQLALVISWQKCACVYIFFEIYYKIGRCADFDR